MSLPKIRVLQVGYGLIAKGMLKVLRTLPWYETAGVVDPRPEARVQAQQDLSLAAEHCYADLGTALRACPADAVFINTPSEGHFEQTRTALAAGRHVLVAKPLTNQFAQAVELVEQADAQGLRLAAGQQIRFNRHYQAVARCIASGKLGTVESVIFLNAKPRPVPANLVRMDQPALWEMSCHHFDSLLALFPDAHAEGVSIDGFRLSWSPYSGPCMVHGLIRFAGGPHVLYHAGFSSRADCYELRLEGSRGALRCRGIHMAHDSMAYEWAEAGGPWTPCAVDDGIPARNPWFEFFERWRIFLDAGGNPSFSGQRNLQVLAMLDAALESERSNAFVQVAGNPRFEKAFERHSREHVSAS